jgi:hypothetical protein
MKTKLKTITGAPLRVALHSESNGKKSMWVAHCMDFDLVAQGKTVGEAQENFLKTLRAHVYLSMKNGEAPFINMYSE